MAVTVRVKLFGTVLPSAFDLAGFIFQVPRKGLSSARNWPAVIAPRTNTHSKRISLFIITLPSIRVGPTLCHASASGEYARVGAALARRKLPEALVLVTAVATWTDPAVRMAARTYNSNQISK